VAIPRDKAWAHRQTLAALPGKSHGKAACADCRRWAAGPRGAEVVLKSPLTTGPWSCNASKAGSPIWMHSIAHGLHGSAATCCWGPSEIVHNKTTNRQWAQASTHTVLQAARPPTNNARWRLRLSNPRPMSVAARTASGWLRPPGQLHAPALRQPRAWLREHLDKADTLQGIKARRCLEGRWICRRAHREAVRRG
jgi:hypothetical protein